MKKTILLFFFFSCLTGTSLFSQVQVGTDIDGEQSYDFSGNSVSMSADGNRIAIGAPFNDGNGSESGSARVYEWNGQNWVQLGTDIDGGFMGDLFGISIAISADGSRVAITANQAFGSEFSPGYVRVYEYNGTDWALLGTLIQGETPGDGAGDAVALSDDGSIMALGSVFSDGSPSGTGQVRVFEYTGGSWMLKGSDIHGEHATSGAGSGVSLSADGLTVAVGAWNNDGNGEKSGNTRVYEFIAGDWVQKGSDIDGEAAGDRSGHAVALSSDGNIVAIGAPWNDGNGEDAGQVRVYEWSAGSWVQLGQDLDGEAAGDRSGHSVAISSDGSKIVVGAPRNEGTPGVFSGQARVFEYNGSSWTQVGLDIDGEGPGDESGQSVSMNAAGDLVAIGALYNNGAAGDDTGHVRVFNVDGMPVSVDQIEGSNTNIKVFPNPTQSFVNIEGEGIQSVKLYNQAGQLLFHSETDVPAIDLTKFPVGTYLIKVETDKGIYSQQIVRSL